MQPAKDTCATCAGLIRLCGGLDFFPADAEVRRLLIERLHVVSANHDHAKAIINAWLTTETTAPKVADLVNLSKKIREPGKGELPAGCNICRGEYWVITELGAMRCRCARGQALSGTAPSSALSLQNAR